MRFPLAFSSEAALGLDKLIAARRSDRVHRKAASALRAALPRPFVFERSDRSLGGGSPPRGVLAVHHGTAAWTDLRAVPDHAGGDSLDVGDFMAA
jgi:hypothetical protein